MFPYRGSSLGPCLAHWQDLFEGQPYWGPEGGEWTWSRGRPKPLSLSNSAGPLGLWLAADTLSPAWLFQKVGDSHLEKPAGAFFFFWKLRWRAVVEEVWLVPGDRCVLVQLTGWGQRLGVRAMAMEVVSEK